MSNSDLEALATPRIKEAIRSAIEKIGREEFTTVAGIQPTRLEEILGPGEEYLPVMVVSLACQINKSHGDTDTSHSSLTECLKGTIVQIPQRRVKPPEGVTAPGPLRQEAPRASRRGGAFYDPKSFRLLSFGVNTITFLILGYFLGGFGLAPLVGLPRCTGVTLSPPSLSPCLGSVLGLVIGSVVGLVYTYYYFVRKL